MAEGKRAGGQSKLFDEPVHFPNGLVYRPNFITEEEEKLLLAFIKTQRLERATLTEAAIESKKEAGTLESEYAKRRYKHFGASMEGDRVIAGPPLPPVIARFARKIEKWLDIGRGRVVEALINEYTEGTQLGWHTDREGFEHIAGISLGGWARMRFRPLPAGRQGLARKGERSVEKVISIEVEPRSAYVMQKDVRWQWQHSVALTRTLRYSLTLRTLPRGTRVPKGPRPGRAGA